ncbi:MAG TPA: NYN domain-containing protein [Pseudonocardiaceae bacterium]|nr:NYN domain-containing protein [Pseudonocardiaceae bacterium]
MTSSAGEPTQHPEQPAPGPLPAPAEAQSLESVESPESVEALESGVPDWTQLPDAVRGRLAELAADAVGEIASVDVPQAVRPVARFAPAKRARLGAGPLLAGLRNNSAFRAAVVRWAGDKRPSALDTTSPDPTAAAVAALLTGESTAPHFVELVTRRARDGALRAERDAAVSKLGRLEAELERIRADVVAAGDVAGRAVSERDQELEKLRKRLREQGAKLREAKDLAAAALADAEQMRVQTELEKKSLIAERDRERERAEAARLKARRAEGDAQAARQAAREARAADEVRLALLVDTLDGAVTGLRRELALGNAGPRPADLVRGASAPQGAVGRADDPAALDRLLALPSVHLVVDGYNVTKTGYPDLALVDQRERLGMQMASLAARTGAEITVVFDGAGVVAVPSASPRGVRVLFSDPGVLADDVIRAIVAAEPEGRPVVVVTSDRAVADSVRRRGAHPVPSAVLIARLGRV